MHVICVLRLYIFNIWKFVTFLKKNSFNSPPNQSRFRFRPKNCLWNTIYIEYKKAAKIKILKKTHKKIVLLWDFLLMILFLMSNVIKRHYICFVVSDWFYDFDQCYSTLVSELSANAPKTITLDYYQNTIFLINRFVRH